VGGRDQVRCMQMAAYLPAADRFDLSAGNRAQCPDSDSPIGVRCRWNRKAIGVPDRGNQIDIARGVRPDLPKIGNTPAIRRTFRNGSWFDPAGKHEADWRKALWVYQTHRSSCEALQILDGAGVRDNTHRGR